MKWRKKMGGRDLSRILKNKNLATLVKCAKFSTFLRRNPRQKKQLFLTENALKLTCGSVEFQNFRERTPESPLQGKGKGGRMEWKREGVRGEEREWGSRKGRGGTGGLKERERKERGEKEEERGEEFGPPPMFQSDRRHCSSVNFINSTFP
jgi:hypothetical protein